jgi:F-type H+-transporting ATPase subunit epsilon
MKLFLEIITPTKVIFQEEIEELTINTSNGQISILPGHVDLFTKVMPGEAIVRIGNKIQSLAVTGGFLELSKNKISILADYAIKAEDIDISKVEEAKQRAEKAMKEKIKEQEFESLQDDIRRASLQLKIARKHHARRSSS